MNKFQTTIPDMDPKNGNHEGITALRKEGFDISSQTRLTDGS